MAPETRGQHQRRVASREGRDWLPREARHANPLALLSLSSLTRIPCSRLHSPHACTPASLPPCPGAATRESPSQPLPS